MKTALIGYTGFVGSNLKQQYNFAYHYNSKNIKEMEKQEYDLVVCAGVSAVKWIANSQPEMDLANIQSLQNVLSSVSAKQFILISTIDVYPVTEGKDERFDCSSMQNHAYGKHRLAFEEFCKEVFKNCIIVRLPGLFGCGLKKNVIYDLLNDNCLEMINTKSSYQYYYLKNLWKDIQTTAENQISLINLFTAPISTKVILTTFFPSKIVGKKAVPEGHYDLYSKYARHWGHDGNYIYTESEVMRQLSEFIEDYQTNQGT